MRGSGVPMLYNTEEDMSRKSLALIIIALILVLLLIGGYFVYQARPKVDSPTVSLPTSCTEEPEGTPVITSISAGTGSVGTKLEIRGCNFAGFEGDKNAWIENSKGVKGLLRGDAGSTSKSLKATVNSPLCQKDTSYSGFDCDAFLTLTPGPYKIYVLPWGRKSNEVSFMIK